jgi:hypothetical protein
MTELIHRVRDIVDFCWTNFSAKVGGGLIDVNKEASMQLHFAYLLKNTIDLIVYHKDERVTIELETGISLNGRTRECDIVIKIEKGDAFFLLPLEMKCYKKVSSSGGLRGAQDLFRFGVYEDLQLLEGYNKKDALIGFQLTMTDSRNFVFPKSKAGKSWDYDISEGTIIKGGVKKDTPIGGKNVEIRLTGSYHFLWNKVGDFYFLKLENQAN